MALDRRPNIVVFMTDQQHHSTVGPGSPCVTPNLDRLVDRGILFRNAFTPSPICTPARSSFQTGLYPHQHMMVHNAHHGKNHHLVSDHPDGTRMLGNLLQDAGYRTAYFGKWDSGITKKPPVYGYEEYVGNKDIPPSSQRSDNPAPELYDHVVIPGEQEERRALIAAKTTAAASDTTPMRIANHVGDAIRRFAGSKEPFFIFASCTEPHVPWICPEELASIYDPLRIALPASYEDSLEDKPTAYSRHYNKQNYCRFAGRPEEMARALALYYGVISGIDMALGSMLDALEDAGCLDDTVFVFTSDHGELMGAHGLIGKDEILCDDLVRVPLVVSCPGRFTAATRNEFVSLVDVFATVAEIAQANETIPPTSRSFAGLLADGTDQAASEQPQFFEHNGSSFFSVVRGVRTDRYKYVFRPHDRDELYDLHQDPLETHNLDGDPGLSDVQDELKRALVEWMEATSDQAAKGARYVLLDLPAVEPS